MGLLVVKADFVGKYAVAKSITDKLDAYIEEYEEKLLIELFGPELFVLFKADVNATTKKPVLAKYLNLYNSLQIDSWGCPFTSSNGLKNMLLGFIYFYYVRDERIKISMDGAVINKTEASEPVNMNFLYNRYNESVQSYNVIQHHAYDNRTLDYPTLNGTPKKISSWV